MTKVSVHRFSSTGQLTGGVVRGHKGFEQRGVCMCEWDIVKLLEVDEVSPSLPVLWPTVVEHRFKLQERSSQPSNT